MIAPVKSSSGTRAFAVLWFGQLVSLIGTAMTTFALLIWLWEDQGTATSIALYLFAGWLAFLIVTPVAGILIDRLDRRTVMMVSDMGAALVTGGLLLLFATDKLSTWHIYAAEGFYGVFDAFQIPAVSTTITMLIPKDQLARANGFMSFAYHASRVGGPAAAAVLLTRFDIVGVMLADLITFLVAVGTLAVIQIPRPPASSDGQAARGGMWGEIQYGMRYIKDRPGLRGLTAMSFGVYMLAALTYFSILPAMVLARSGGDENALAIVQSMMGVGGVLGAIVMSIWGGSKRRVLGYIAGIVLSFMLGDLLLAIGRNVSLWAFAGFNAALFIPLITAPYEAIWQSKVAPDIQGRVFSTRQWISTVGMPFGYLITGPIADRLLEPALLPAGSLVPLLGRLVGTGPGAGMASMFLFTGLGGILIGIAGYLYPPVRNIDTDLPDFE